MTYRIGPPFFCSLPITKYRIEPKKEKKITTSTHMSLLFPSKLLLRISISAANGNKKAKSTINSPSIPGINKKIIFKFFKVCIKVELRNYIEI
jgi:hypothetical protein